MVSLLACSGSHSQLAGVAVGTGLLSLAAAVLPAAWAGRRSVLNAIATE